MTSMRLSIIAPLHSDVPLFGLDDVDEDAAPPPLAPPLGSSGVQTLLAERRLPPMRPPWPCGCRRRMLPLPPLPPTRAFSLLEVQLRLWLRK